MSLKIAKREPRGWRDIDGFGPSEGATARQIRSRHVAGRDRICFSLRL